MKKITLISLLTIISVNAFSQIITENVNFDNYVSSDDNDFSNNFIKNPNSLITQISTNGIIGGALTLPPNHNPSNMVTYRSKYKNIEDSTMVTSMSFKYKSNLKIPNSSSSALVIRLKGNGWPPGQNTPIDFVLDNQITNSIFIKWENIKEYKNVYLADNHWYKMSATYKTLLSYVISISFAEIELFDLGINGTDLPISIGKLSSEPFWGHSSLTYADDFVISFVSYYSSGIEYLDNFTFNGIKSGTISDSHPLEVPVNYSLGIKDNKLISTIELYPNPIYDILKINIPEFSKENRIKLQIYNIIGKMIYSKPIEKMSSEINLSSFSNSIYILKIIDNKGIIHLTKKIIKK